MSVKIRMSRGGAKNRPHYKIVVADSRMARDGRFIQIIGTYNPRTEPSTISIDSDKAVKWLMDGAQPTDRVKKLLEASGAWEAFTTAKSAAKAK
jgi:small subunit ribosomal protein S16